MLSTILSFFSHLRFRTLRRRSWLAGESSTHRVSGKLACDDCLSPGPSVVTRSFLGTRHSLTSLRQCATYSLMPPKACRLRFYCHRYRGAMQRLQSTSDLVLRTVYILTGTGCGCTSNPDPTMVLSHSCVTRKQRRS